MIRKSFFTLVSLLFSLFLFARYHISGHLKIQNSWQHELYLFRVNTYSHSATLEDSLRINKNADFDYFFPVQKEKYVIYKILIPVKGPYDISDADGDIQNFFFIITEKQGSCRITANGDSVYFTTKYFNSLINSRLKYFQDLQRPFYFLSIAMRDSVSKHPESTRSIQINVMNQLDIQKAKIKTDLQNLLLTTPYEPIARIGLNYLFGLQEGELDSNYVRNILNRFNRNHRHPRIINSGTKNESLLKPLHDAYLSGESGLLIPLPFSDSYPDINLYRSAHLECMKQDLSGIPLLISSNEKDHSGLISVSIDLKMVDWQDGIKTVAPGQSPGINHTTFLFNGYGLRHCQ